jgi:hypothetical protein
MKINILIASSALTSERAERRAAPKPARASRGTRMALRPSKPAQAGLEPRPTFPLRDRPPSPAGEGLS